MQAEIIIMEGGGSYCGPEFIRQSVSVMNNELIYMIITL